MIYNLHFYKKGKLQKIIKEEEIYMYGEGNKFLSCNVPFSYDELRLFDKDNRYIVTYRHVNKKDKSILKR